jgi:putative oxidoreductase
LITGGTNELTKQMKGKKNGKALNITLWIVQGLTAALMLMSAFMKIATPIPELSAKWKWTGELPQQVVRMLGIVDLLGGIGIILPAILKIKPGLTPLAAVGVVLLMISATVFHISRGESSVIAFNIILMLFASFIAWGRYKKLPILPRQ